MNWHLQDAKNNFSKVVQKARTEGPQTVTLRGEPAVMVIAIDEYRQLLERRPSLAAFLLTGPEWDDDFVADVNRRNKSGPRDVDLD